MPFLRWVSKLVHLFPPPRTQGFEERWYQLILTVRRETGKEYMVKVRDDKGLANHIDPKPCVDVRESIGEASVGESVGQP